MNKKNNIDYFNLELKNIHNRIILTLVIILVILLLFRKKFNSTIERIIVFIIIFLLFLVLSNNLVITIIGSSIIFLLVNLIIKYRDTMENFQNEKIEEPSFDKNIFETPEFKKSSDGIKELLKKVNGGIELKDDDLKETDKLNINLDKYSDDKKPNVLKQAQKEAYELIDTVNALKDTVSTLAPVLTEGKKLMSIFESLKF